MTEQPVVRQEPLRHLAYWHGSVGLNANADILLTMIKARPELKDFELPALHHVQDRQSLVDCLVKHRLKLEKITCD